MDVTLWKEKRGWCGAIGNLGFFPPIFSLKLVPALVALTVLHDPAGMLWPVATEHQSTQGRDAPREEVPLH